MTVGNLRTIKALADELQHVPVTEAQLRWYVFNAAENGLGPAVVRRAGRVFIDKPGFERWIFTGKAG